MGLAHTLSASLFTTKRRDPSGDVVPQDGRVLLVGGKVNYSFRHESVPVLECHRKLILIVPPLGPCN